MHDIIKRAKVYWKAKISHLRRSKLHLLYTNGSSLVEVKHALCLSRIILLKSRTLECDKIPWNTTSFQYIDVDSKNCCTTAVLKSKELTRHLGAHIHSCMVLSVHYEFLVLKKLSLVITCSA